MGRHWRVVVEGGDDNLYRISEYDGTFRAYQVTIGAFFNEHLDNIGEADSLEEALVLIMSHSGDEIDRIEEVD
jgi:hypothetical protein